MNMDDSGHRENGRYRTDQYRSLHTQWIIPQHHIKDHDTIKLMTLMAERDTAIQERDLALSEKKVALAERDMAMLQRDAAIAERNSAIMERDNAINALEFTRQNMDGSGRHGSLDMESSPPQLSDAPFDHMRGMHISDALPISSTVGNDLKVKQSKRHKKETKTQVVTPKKAANSPRKSKRGSKNPADASGNDLVRGGEGRKKRASVRNDYEWKDQDLGLNQVKFDESSMPPPVCSCTGRSQQCYKWGVGGWQSACCTTKMSMYPLPMVPGKPHARVGGRKMSGSAFAKLLSRLAAEGHDLSMPLDLKNHWARHGTNRYITIR